MNIYLLKNPSKNFYFGTFISAVVIAESVSEARKMHPQFCFERRWLYNKNMYTRWKDYFIDSWCDPKEVEVTKIGVAEPWNIQPKVLLFNCLDY